MLHRVGCVAGAMQQVAPCKVSVLLANDDQYKRTSKTNPINEMLNPILTLNYKDRIE